MISNDSYHSYTDFTGLDGERVTGLDVYRIIACMLVVINHCNSKVMYQLQPHTLAWYVTVVTFYVTKVAVPGFFMIAGYNLLHKEDDWNKAWNRVKRILVALVVFSLIYYVWKVIRGEIVIGDFSGITFVWENIKIFASIFLTRPITDAFWYLYAYLGIMIMLPFLQKLTARMNDKDVKVFLVLALVFLCVIPTLGEFVPLFRLAEDFNLPIMCVSVTYMLIGHYFYLNFDERGDLHRKSNTGFRKLVFDNKGHRDWVLILGIILGLIINMIISITEFDATGGAEFLSVGKIEYFPLMLESVCLFALLMRLHYAKWVGKLVAVIAPTTFGIYLLTDMLCAETNMLYFNLCPHMNRLFAVAIEDVVVILLGFAIINAMRLVPIIRKYI